MDFPRFGNAGGEDPLAFIEHCEECLAIYPLLDNQILPTLSSVLEHTAKNWWRAVHVRILTWTAFKDMFLHAFMSKDHDLEAGRRIQRPDEHIRDFAFQYQALCL